MTTVVIRDVEPEDQPAIARLWQTLSEYHLQIDARMPKPTPDAAQDYAARLLERRDDPYTRTFVAEVNGGVVGYILGAVVDLQPDLFEHVDTGFIADLFVELPYRQHGIGRLLVETMTDWFRTQGVRAIELQVAAANEAGIRFWKAVGGDPIVVRMRIDVRPSNETPAW
jgi:GNAT superfamily N-acetyltransferase